VSQSAGSGDRAIAVRLGTPEDAQLLAELGALAFQQAFGADNSPENMQAYLAQAFGAEIQAKELEDPASEFLIAVAAQTVVGYARLREGPAPQAIEGAAPIEIVRFYPHPEWIGRGVGSALMRSCLKRAYRRRMQTIWLDVWEHNRRARVFYERWGFRDVGVQAFRLGDDVQTDILMARSCLPRAGKSRADGAVSGS
jgi:ribosomal protein S18 acetylase RimI-like enzyme